MNVVAIGINHRTAPLEVRERLWFSVEEIRSLLPALRNKWFSECFLVSTCNRTELYGIEGGESARVPTEEVTKFLLNAKSANGVIRQEHLYTLRSTAAASHLFKVASGTDSMILGDVQILHQMKEDFGLAREQSTVGIFLNRLVQSALHVGKRCRSETSISEGAVSVSYAAVELASKIFENLSTKNVLLIGAGETGELTARHMVDKGVGRLVIANRTRQKAQDLATALGGTVVEFEQVHNELAHVDIVVTSIDAPHYILTASQLSEAMKLRSHKPILIIDIGVPRNVEPGSNKIENVFLHDIDMLSGIVGRNIEQRKAQIPKVNAIILEELRDLYAWDASLEVNPTITELHAYFEQIRRAEVEKNASRFSGRDKELLELVTRRIVNKLLHNPTAALKNGHEESDEGRRKRMYVVRSLFGLDKK